MSDVANFKIYYGRGTIMEGPEGIDLRYFQSAAVPLPRPEQRTFGAVMRWLFHTFQVDRDVYDLRLSCLAPRAGQPTYWELVQLKGTNSWQSYVRMAREGGWKLVLLVQAYAKPTPPSAAEQEGGADAEEEVGDSSHSAAHTMAEAPGVADAVDEDHAEVAPSVRQASGLADEGEELEALVQRMDLEDQDYMALSEDEGSDDEDDVDQQAVPSEWNTYQFDNLVVNEGSRVPWEYDQSEVRLGAMYKCKEAVQDAVKFWALSVRRTFTVVKSTPRFYDVKCSIEGCP